MANTIKFWQVTFFNGKQKRFGERIFLTKEAANIYARMSLEEDKSITDWDLELLIYEDFNNILK